ncbi:galactose oxidase [Gigaspora margarita]|uniref:Galactose oxidase n=1 Tax=Gigaspora margarita TaxID=4874 RepID=A0A8H4ER52_GIGMA|nr:galactose oxidase [Gigaspora margarita]
MILMQDVSKPFTTTNNGSIPWVDLTYTGGPLKTQATACIGGKNNDMICGFSNFSDYSVANQSFVNQFDTNKQQWINITSVGNVPTNRYAISCANFDNGLITIFSGMFNSSSINDLWIFNTLTLTWSLSNVPNAPSPMFGYSSLLLIDCSVYNTKSDTWTNMSISGPTPSVRRSFSTVLTSDGRTIIFGGYNTEIFGDLWILDITIFQWSMGKILNPIVNLTLGGHTAALVDNYMFVSFGRFDNFNYSSRILMLDVSRKDSYKWVTEFTPNTTTTTTVATSSSNTSFDSKNTSIIIGAIIGSIISFIIFVIASILTLKFIDKTCNI